MTLNDVYRKYLHELQRVYTAGEASNITSIIFEYFAGLSKSDVIKDPSRNLDEPLVTQLNESLHELLQHKPVQYVTGEAWFCGMRLKVSRAVLIPRPETEELVMEVTDFIGQQNIPVLDIGTGSGCIAIAIKKNKVNAHVTAIDISSDALQIARENAKEQKTVIDFLELDFLDENSWKKLGNYDVIISNPPYIPETEKQLLGKNVTEHEPHTALFVAADEPVIFYKKIATFGKVYLNPGGKIFMETHEDYTNQVAAHFEQQGYEAGIKKDMFEKDRMVVATKLFLTDSSEGHRIVCSQISQKGTDI